METRWVDEALKTYTAETPFPSGKLIGRDVVRHLFPSKLPRDTCIYANEDVIRKMVKEKKAVLRRHTTFPFEMCERYNAFMWTWRAIKYVIEIVRYCFKSFWSCSNQYIVIISSILFSPESSGLRESQEDCVRFKPTRSRVWNQCSPVVVLPDYGIRQWENSHPWFLDMGLFPGGEEGMG